MASPEGSGEQPRKGLISRVFGWLFHSKSWNVKTDYRMPQTPLGGNLDTRTPKERGFGNER